MGYLWTIGYLGTAVIAASIALLGWLWTRWKTRGHFHWPMAEGTVESYRFEQGRYTKTWFIVYSYSANGEYYSGEFVAQLPWLNMIFKSKDTLEDMVKERYPRETKFALRFKPEDPQWSVPFSRQPTATGLTLNN